MTDSVPDFPEAVEPPKGAPNVLLILTDDVGFGASSTFGGPIPTPNFDRVANAGLKYAYQGTLKKLYVVLQPERLDEKERQRLLELLAHASLAVH